jgi:hypothetical protein
LLLIKLREHLWYAGFAEARLPYQVICIHTKISFDTENRKVDFSFGYGAVC